MQSTAEENIDISASQKLHEVENLTNELKRLLVHHETALDEEGVRREMETLERWMESYRRGLAAANKISETGIGWLSELRDRLKMAASERLRLEDEGGNTASGEQHKHTEDLLAAANHIEKAMPVIEQMFKHPEEEHA